MTPDPTWMGSVKKSGLPPGCTVRGIDMGKLTVDPDALGIEAAAGAKDVEASPPLTCKDAKPGGGAMELWKRDTQLPFWQVLKGLLYANVQRFPMFA